MCYWHDQHCWLCWLIYRRSARDRSAINGWRNICFRFQRISLAASFWPESWAKWVAARPRLPFGQVKSTIDGATLHLALAGWAVLFDDSSVRYMSSLAALTLNVNCKEIVCHLGACVFLEWRLFTVKCCKLSAAGERCFN